MNLKSISLHTWRRFTQITFGFIFSNCNVSVFWTRIMYEGPLRSICVPALNCHSCPTAIMGCPIGIIQHYLSIQQFPFFLVGFLGLIGILGGRIMCGWICPFGLVQELFFKIKTKKFHIPRFFTFFKYAILIIFVIILPYLTSIHWFSRLCPWGGLEAAIPWVLWNPKNPLTNTPTITDSAVGEWFWVKIGILTLFLILFIFTRRPFCQTTCPLGAIFSFFNKYSLLKIDVSEKCNKCHSCNEKCTVDMIAFENANTINCVKCFECAECTHIKVRFNLNNVNLPLVNSPKMNEKKKLL